MKAPQHGTSAVAIVLCLRNRPAILVPHWTTNPAPGDKLNGTCNETLMQRMPVDIGPGLHLHLLLDLVDLFINLCSQTTLQSHTATRG